LSSIIKLSDQPSDKAVKTGGEMKAAIDKDLAVNILYDSGS